MTLNILEMYLCDTGRAYYAVENGEVIILMPDSRKTYFLGPVGTKIWELSDGKYKVKKIIDILCEEFQVARGVLIRDTVKFIRELSKKHLLKLSKTDKPLS